MNVIQDWIDTVAYSHSKSIETEKKKYRWSIKVFCEFIGKTPEQILEEYEGVSDIHFRRKYARYVRGLIGELNRQELAVNSVKGIVTGVKSFFRPRDRAFFCVMAQTGLRPQTLCNLKLKHVEPEYFSDGKTPSHSSQRRASLQQRKRGVSKTVIRGKSYATSTIRNFHTNRNRQNNNKKKSEN